MEGNCEILPAFGEILERVDAKLMVPMPDCEFRTTSCSSGVSFNLKCLQAKIDFDLHQDESIVAI